MPGENPNPVPTPRADPAIIPAASRPLSPPPPRPAPDKQYRTKPLSRTAQLALQEIQNAAAARCDAVVAADMEDREMTNQTPPWTFDPRSGTYRQEILPVAEGGESPVREVK